MSERKVDKMVGITLIANAVGYDHMWNFGWGQMAFWMVVMVTVVVGCVALVLNATRHPKKPYQTALEALAEMYAKGEIDDAEYQHRRQTLGK